MRHPPKGVATARTSTLAVDAGDRAEVAEEVLSALDWAQVRAMAADGLSQREIARRLGANRRTVARLQDADEPPRYRREPRGSMLDPLEPVMRRVLEDWPEVKAPRMTELLRDCGYKGSVDLVRRRLAELRPREVRPAQRTGYRPAQVMQLDWAEMPTRPRAPAASGGSMRSWRACPTAAPRPPTSPST